MYCINRVPAVKPGNDRGVAITAGGKMKGKMGPMKGKVIFPFIKATPQVSLLIFQEEGFSLPYIINKEV